VAETGPVFLGIGNITDDGHLDLGKVRHIAEEDFPRWTKRVTPQAGDIVFTYEATLNRYAIIPSGFRGCLGRRLALIRPNPNEVDTRFLHYYFFSQDWRETIEANKLAGATVDRIPLTHFPKFPINVPPLSVQRRIASILSTYDDLIENNTRRIEVLEEMARRLYDEWFVRFRFPGHEEVAFEESELGPLPRGWEVCTVAETFAILGGGTPSKKEPAYWEDGSINWYAPTDLTKAGTTFMDTSGSKINELGLRKSSARLFPPFSVMMTSRATIGVISINTTPACTNQGFITCLPNERFPLYLLCNWLRSNVEMFISLGTGATFKEITKGTFKTIQLRVPPQDLASKFQEAVEPMMALVLRLQRKNANLRAQRDLLLPKLISGQIDVSQAEEMTKEAAA
jgi:type I restriction enzyme S subunit